MFRPSTSNKRILKRQLTRDSYAVEKIETSVVLKHGKFRLGTPLWFLISKDGSSFG